MTKPKYIGFTDEQRFELFARYMFERIEEKLDHDEKNEEKSLKVTNRDIKVRETCNNYTNRP